MAAKQEACPTGRSITVTQRHGHRRTVEDPWSSGAGRPGAIRANDFSRQADEYGQAGGDHASSRTHPDDAERQTGIYGSDARRPPREGYTRDERPSHENGGW